jgi:hypothetical protein
VCAPTRTASEPCRAPTSPISRTASSTADAASGGHPDHHRVPDALDLLGLELGQQLADALVEVGDGVRGHLVVVRLGHGREAGEVGEEERVVRRPRRHP